MNDAHLNFLLIGGVVILLFFTLIHNKIIRVLKNHRELHETSFWVSRIKILWCNECSSKTKHMVSNNNPFYWSTLFGFISWFVYLHYKVGDGTGYLMLFGTGLMPSSIIFKLIWPLFGFIILFTLISFFWGKFLPPTTKCVLCHPDEFNLYKNDRTFVKSLKFIGMVILMLAGYIFTGLWLLSLYLYIFPPFFMQN